MKSEAAKGSLLPRIRSCQGVTASHTPRGRGSAKGDGDSLPRGWAAPLALQRETKRETASEEKSAGRALSPAAPDRRRRPQAAEHLVAPGLTQLGTNTCRPESADPGNAAVLTPKAVLGVKSNQRSPGLEIPGADIAQHNGPNTTHFP